MAHVQTLHLVTCLLSGYLFLVFAYWWLNEGNPTTIYKITCGLMFGICLSSLGAWMVFHRVANGTQLDDIYNMDEAVDYLTHLRLYFVIIPLVVYTAHVTKKLIINNGHSNPKEPERKDRSNDS